MKRVFAVFLILGVQQLAIGQALQLTDILDSIERHHPILKMYDAEIQSMDAVSKGARNWMAPEISSGFWMTPYNLNLWKKGNSGSTGMGQYMISAEQMFPNEKYQVASENYQRAVSAAASETKKSWLNELFAQTKENYYAWIIIEKKLLVIDESDRLLELMISNAETRYKNGLGKISSYYKAKAAQGHLAKTKIMLQNDALQKQIALNTLMNRDKLTPFSIDTTYSFADYSSEAFDSSMFYNKRSDLKAIDENIRLNFLNQQLEAESLKPQFGLQFAHMFGFGGLPEQFTLMGTMKIPLAGWSSKQSHANVEGLKWKAISMENQKQVLANEYSGMAYGLRQDMVAKKKQLLLFENSIIPALRRNYQSTLLAYEQNTEELFTLYDAWETLNSSQLEYLDQVQELLNTQVKLEKVLEIK
jgi:outer membrane protein TolC